MSQKEYKYKINGIKFNVVVDDPQGDSVHVEVNGVPYTVELDRTPGEKPVIKPSPGKGWRCRSYSLNQNLYDRKLQPRLPAEDMLLKLPSRALS